MSLPPHPFSTSPPLHHISHIPSLEIMTNNSSTHPGLAQLDLHCSILVVRNALSSSIANSSVSPALPLSPPDTTLPLLLPLPSPLVGCERSGVTSSKELKISTVRPD